MSLVQTYILRGKPVASANNHRATARGGSVFLRSSPAYQQWKDLAVAELDDLIKASGHDTQLELIVSYKTGKSGKKRKITTRKIHNPVFTKALLPNGYLITLWYYMPKYTYKRDVHGDVVFTTGKNPRPQLKPYQGDKDGIIKGIYDVLQIAGAIDNDAYVEVGPVYTKHLPDDETPFVGILIEPYDPTTVPECPFLPSDSSVYMPRVYEGSHDWHVQRQQEKAFKEYREKQGEDTTVIRIAKCRCQKCQILIGQGYKETSIWAHWGSPTWKESRWQNEVVYICGNCALERMKYEDAEVDEIVKLDTVAWLKQHGYGQYDWDTCYQEDSAAYPIYKETFNLRRREQSLIKAYAMKYCLVSSEEIGSITWAEIAKRRAALQETISVKSRNNSKHDSANTDGTRPQGKSRRLRRNNAKNPKQPRADRRQRPVADGNYGGPVDSGELFDEETSW